MWLIVRRVGMVHLRNGMVSRSAVALFVLLILLSSIATGQKSESNRGSTSQFTTQIAPLLARRCVECHNRSLKQGGLDLSQAATARAGGSHGPAIVPGKPE